MTAAVVLFASTTSAEVVPVTAEILTSEVPVRGPWVKIEIACTSPEGTVCNGSIGLSGVAHSIGAGRVGRLSAFREINFLGGEDRAVAVRLLRGVWTAVSEGRAREARVSVSGRAGGFDATRVVKLVPG